ncbi:MAG TPA: hypothetical protein VN228_11025 [Pyrinomonadaceae bacterium]|nr:hypothetical protein [Pyrinomonadaceae bacterium]
MLPRTRPAVVLGWLLLVAAAFAHSSSHARQQTGAQPGPTPRPPTIKLDADTQVVTLCPDSESVANPRVRLRATGFSPDGNPLRYRWTVSGGRTDTIEGTDVVWDLTDARPGVYTASVTLESGPAGGDPLCTAFTSTRVVVRTCPPPRPVCPNVSIYCPDVTQTGAPITFTASVSGGTAGVTPVYNWRVSEGTILSGQGTPSITVDTAGLGGRQITATVEVEGYNLECRASCQSSLPAPPVATSTEYGEIARDDEKARLDLFAIELQNSPGARGYIIGYGGSRPRYGDGQARADRARDYLVNQRGVEAGRLVTVNGGSRPTGATELWVVPPGADAPRPR